MELRQLRHFIAVAEEANFTRAADRCHIVQSALSTSIRLLEEELKAKLFLRNTRQVSLTAAGAAFLQRTRQALDILDQAVMDLADVQAMRKGRLSIGTVQSLPPFLNLPELLARFYRDHPEIEVKLIQGAAPDLNEKIASRALDLAIIPIEERGDKLAAHVVACDDMVLACSRSHALASRKSIGLKQLTTEPFVDFVAGQGTRRLVDRAFAEAGLARRVALEVADLDTLIDFIRQGMGVGLLPAAIVGRHGGSLASIPLKGKELCWELVVTHIRSSGPRQADALDVAPATFLQALLSTTAIYAVDE
ncbi:LysR family transcriptional regulator [Bordetella genomosp. 8]|uniref:LysR family transcriptional regulator n=1 Tax=Bordetella genomosp. 8 TaxID=1416806 RepID=A0A1W6YPI9_9BORD|nr:LysR family transcriptional regulator [Bordetella genomosp. 8]ARP83005.1 LysR family transcriptional regulator [Bordetella genomosp. 8]